MQKASKYVIFETNWGYFGLAGTRAGLRRTCLPGPRPAGVRARLLEDLPEAEFDADFFKTLQEQIAAYFEGECVDFGMDVPLLLDGFSPFFRKVLAACRDVKIGQTATYSELAERAGSPGAGRAAGSVMAANPLPLMIPCHRIIRSDGRMGGFTAPGGIPLKKRMLELERRACSHLHAGGSWDPGVSAVSTDSRPFDLAQSLLPLH
jgi:methylated-DNA-[protein]-cysteine S-methyltransferase